MAKRKLNFKCLSCEAKFADEGKLRTHSLFTHGMMTPSCSTQVFEVNEETRIMFVKYIDKMSPKITSRRKIGQRPSTYNPEHMIDDYDFTFPDYSKHPESKQIWARILYASQWLIDNYPRYYPRNKERASDIDWNVWREIIKHLPSSELDTQKESLSEFFHEMKRHVSIKIYSKNIPNDIPYRKEVDFMVTEVFGHDDNDFYVNEQNRINLLHRIIYDHTPRFSSHKNAHGFYYLLGCPSGEWNCRFRLYLATHITSK